MPERKISRVQEYWGNIKEQVTGELAVLLEQGRVLTTADVAEVASKQGFSPRSILNVNHFTRFKEGEWFIGPVKIVSEAVHGYSIVRSAGIPVEQTDFETVSERLRQQVLSRNRHTFPWLQQEKPE